MALKKIEERLSRLQRLVDSWKHNGSVPCIERDIVLAELRDLYNEVLYYPVEADNIADAESVKEAVVEPVVAEPKEEPKVEPEEMLSVVTTAHEDLGEAFDDALDIAALLGLSGDDTIEEAEKAVMESHEESALAEVEVEEGVVNEDAEPMPSDKVATAAGLFDIDDIPVRTRRGRKMISLYDDPAMPTNVAPKVEQPAAQPRVVAVGPTPAPMPVAESAPAVEPVSVPAPIAHAVSQPAPQRLGDVIAQSVTTLADKMAEEQPTATFNRITDIRKAIGLNDRFLMIRDLFAGDANLYEDTINHLNEFEDLDECMIFIVENFRWNPDSEGAKLLVSLIERKLS